MMATLGKRRPCRRPQPDIYWCVCGTDDHRMSLWIEDDDDFGYGEATLTFGHAPLPFWWRWRHVWDMLQGRPAGRSWLVLPYADLVHLRGTLDTAIGMIESMTVEERA